MRDNSASCYVETPRLKGFWLKNDTSKISPWHDLNWFPAGWLQKWFTKSFLNRKGKVGTRPEEPLWWSKRRKATTVHSLECLYPMALPIQMHGLCMLGLRIGVRFLCLAGPPFEKRQNGSFVKWWFWRMCPPSDFRSGGTCECTPRSGFASWGTSECTLVLVFVAGNIRQNRPFGKPPFREPPNYSTEGTTIQLSFGAGSP